MWGLGPRRITRFDPVRRGLEDSAGGVAGGRWRLHRFIDAEDGAPAAVGITPQIAVGARIVGIAARAAGAVLLRQEDGARRPVGHRLRDPRAPLDAGLGGRGGGVAEDVVVDGIVADGPLLRPAAGGGPQPAGARHFRRAEVGLDGDGVDRARPGGPGYRRVDGPVGEIEEVSLFDVGEEPGKGGESGRPAVAVAGQRGQIPARRRGDRRQAALRVIDRMAGDAELLELVFARHAPGGLAGGLNCREEEADEGADDRDHDEQFDEREPAGEARGGPP